MEPGKMEMRKFEPTVYVNSAGQRAVNLGEIAEICNKHPKDVWRELFEMFEDVRAFTVSIVRKGSRHLYFRLDCDGKILDNDAKDMGYNVGGCYHDSVGDWRDVYFLEAFAIQLLKRHRVEAKPDQVMELWEKVEIYWNGNELTAKAQKKIYPRA